jgi:hypothetical protein
MLIGSMQDLTVTTIFGLSHGCSNANFPKNSAGPKLRLLLALEFKPDPVPTRKVSKCLLSLMHNISA